MMKRLPALVLSVVLILCVGVAAAGNPIVTEFADFTLKTQGALDYSSFKVVGQPLFVYYRTVTGEVSTSAVSAIWLPATEPVPAEDFTAMLWDAEPVMRAQQEAKKNTLKSYEVKETAEQELWKKPVLICDVDMLVGLPNSNITVFQRNIRVTGSFGTYIFTLSAFSRKSLEEAADELVQSLKWKD